MYILVLAVIVACVLVVCCGEANRRTQAPDTRSEAFKAIQRDLWATCGKSQKRRYIIIGTGE